MPRQRRSGRRDYGGWLVGETLSGLGSSVSTLAYPLLVLATTGSAARTGLVAAAVNAGSLLTLLVGGWLADRWSRRAVLLAGRLVQAAVVASVAAAVASGHVLLAHLAGAGFVEGAVAGITAGAERAALRRLVPAEDYARASAQLQGRDQAVRVVGPPLGGALFSLGRALPFVVDAASSLAAVAGVAAIRRPLGPDAPAAGERAPEPFVRSAVDGLRLVARDAYLRFTAWWLAAVNALGTGQSLLVLLLLHAHGASPALIGATRSLGAVGGVVGALLAGRVVRGVAGRTLFTTLSWALTAATLTTALSPSPWVIGALVGLVGLAAVPLNVVLVTYEASVVPDGLVGRVSSALDLAGGGLRWVAPLAVGALAETIGLRAAALVWTAAFLAVTVAVQHERSLRVLDRPVPEVVAAPPR